MNENTKTSIQKIGRPPLPDNERADSWTTASGFKKWNDRQLAELATKIETTNAMPAPSKSLDKVLTHIRAGGVAFVATYLTYTEINAKCLAKWEAAGIPLLREDGDGYRMSRGRGSVYLMPGQLKLA